MNDIAARLDGWIRRRRHPFVVAYTALFALAALVCLWPFIAAHRHPMWMGDGLQAHYVRFTGFGWWVRQIVKESIRTGGLVVPQWNLSLGYGGDLFVYLGSYFGNPFNYISIVLPQRLSEWGFDASIILQLYASGLSLGVFARERHLSRFQMLIGAVCYAFSGWTLMGLEQYVFIYPLVLFPLVLVGAERVFKSQSPMPFVVCMASFFLFYFYFAYMACVLLVPYCLLLFWRYERHDVRLLVLWTARILGCIVIGALMAGVLLCPAVMGIVGQDRLGLDRDVPILYSIKTYADYLQGLLVYAQSQENSSFSWGPMGLASVVLLFTHRGLKGLKASVILLTLIALVPMAGSALNGFQYASNRWMWAYALCIAFVVAKMLPSLGAATPRDLLWITVVGLVLGLLLNLRPDDEALLTNPKLLTGLCGLLLVVSVAGANALTQARMGGQACTMRLIVCVGTVLMLWIPYHYVLSEEYLQKRVEAGDAWDSYAGQAVVSAVEQIPDEGLWRYDYNDISQNKNTPFLTQNPSYNIYANLYDQGVNRFSRDVELSDDQRFQANLNLCSRSYLESALGAKYFVVGARKDARTGETRPKQKWLPYGAQAESELCADGAGEGDAAFAYRNDLALPLAYTHARTISMEQYATLTATRKQQLLLQAVALEDEGEAMATDLDSLEFDDRHIAYSFAGVSDGVKVEGNTIRSDVENGSITLRLDDFVAGETYVELVNMTYENPRPQMPEELTRGNLVAYLKDCFEWTHANEYKILAKSDVGGTVNMRNYTRYYHMYAGDNTNMLNLGYSTKPASTVKLVFRNAGVYTFDAINIIVQPVDNLHDLVEERRTYPVDLSMDVNSFTAAVRNDEPQALFLAIPWSRGWSATVDGEEAEVLKADGAFVAVELPKGNHVVELQYHTPGLRIGLALSVAGVALAAILASRRHVPGRRCRRS